MKRQHPFVPGLIGSGNSGSNRVVTKATEWADRLENSGLPNLCLRIVANPLKNANSPYPGRLLRHSRKRPRHSAAKSRDELAPLHPSLPHAPHH